jgi:hypothetical protein
LLQDPPATFSCQKCNRTPVGQQFSGFFENCEMVVSDGDFLRTEASSEKLGIPELKVQLLRRAMTTLAQNMGSVKDIQAP